jgi:16S rRNA (cytosine967-C5)-methyltransferase
MAKAAKKISKSSARFVAVTVLNQFDPKTNYAENILDKILSPTGRTQQTTDLVYGTLRNRQAVDMIIAKLAKCPTTRIPNKILNILRIGVYEFVYCPHTAEYAIVNEAVENTKRIAGKKQTAFVNAVLRKILSHIIRRQTELSDAKPKRTLPQSPDFGCEFDADFLPDSQKQPDDFLAKAFSLPKWLIDDWLDEYGPGSTKQVCFASNRKPSIYLRPNTLQVTAAQLAERLKKARINVEIIANEMIRVKSPKRITELAGFDDGLFSAQDLTAALPVNLLAPKAHWKILDFCAAPGTKTTQLAELTNDNAQIFATDIDSKRLEFVQENIKRLRLKSIKIFKFEQLQNILYKTGKFDAVLLDVPCSNTGVLAKRVELRYRISKRAVSRLAQAQARLLETAAELIEKNGRICYSTCSIQGKENNQLIKNFLKKNRNFKLESENLTLPSAQGFDHDGGYTAIIIKD